MDRERSQITQKLAKAEEVSMDRDEERDGIELPPDEIIRFKEDLLSRGAFWQAAICLEIEREKGKDTKEVDAFSVAVATACLVKALHRPGAGWIDGFIPVEDIYELFQIVKSKAEKGEDGWSLDA